MPPFLAATLKCTSKKRRCFLFDRAISVFSERPFKDDSQKFSLIFNSERCKSEDCIQKVQPCVNLVDLVKGFQTSIYYILLLVLFNSKLILFICKLWLRYSREKASQSLPNLPKVGKIRIHIVVDSRLRWQIHRPRAQWDQPMHPHDDHRAEARMYTALCTPAFEPK